MNMKLIKIVIIATCMFTLAAVVYAVKDVADVIVIKKTGHRKPPIKFNHLNHVQKYNTECIDCHHKGKNKKCSFCHTRKDQGNVINLKGAFHQQCHDCHRKTKGPRACGRCHVTN